MAAEKIRLKALAVEFRGESTIGTGVTDRAWNTHRSEVQAQMPKARTGRNLTFPISTRDAEVNGGSTTVTEK